jgi:small subunit ribosomal protein S16
MAVRIRLKRMGRKNRPFWRICVFDARTRRDGETIEDLGFYDTLANDPAKVMSINADRAKYWLSVGAKPSEIVRQILKRSGVTKTAAAKVEA